MTFSRRGCRRRIWPIRLARSIGCSRSAALRNRPSVFSSSSTPRARQRQIEELVIDVRTTNRCGCATWPTSGRALGPGGIDGFQVQDAVALTVFRRLGGNTVEISEGIRDLLERQPPPREIRATVAYDQSRFIDSAVDNVRDAILIGGVLSVLILLAFFAAGGPRSFPPWPSRYAGDHLAVSVLERRDAEPDVAGRPGGGHRAYH